MVILKGISGLKYEVSFFSDFLLFVMSISLSLLICEKDSPTKIQPFEFV